jgi:NADH-quinone oxidoreductase subunit M
VGVIYERRHTRMIADYGGIARTMPLYATVFLIVTLGAIGLPGTSGFVGEFLVLVGAFRASPWFAAIAALGVIFGAVYMLWLVKRVFFGPETSEANRAMPDLSLRELVVMLPLVAGILFMGVRPTPFLDRMERSIDVQLRHMGIAEVIRDEAPAGGTHGEDPMHGSTHDHGPAPEGEEK